MYVYFYVYALCIGQGTLSNLMQEVLQVIYVAWLYLNCLAAAPLALKFYFYCLIPSKHVIDSAWLDSIYLVQGFQANRILLHIIASKHILVCVLKA